MKRATASSECAGREAQKNSFAEARARGKFHKLDREFGMNSLNANVRPITVTKLISGREVCYSRVLSRQTNYYFSGMSLLGLRAGLTSFSFS
jgi:hypothetical protein